MAESCRVPVAVNFWVVPEAIVASAGETVIEARGEKETTAEPVTVPDAAVMVTEPVLAGVELTSPVLSTDATAGFEEVQVTFSVSMCAVSFANVPIASSCSFVPGAMLGACGFTAIDTSDEAKDAAGENKSMFSGLQAADDRTLIISRMMPAERVPFFMDAVL